ncbi:type IV toxin-antitoxin system AbiEi family antitoxin [Rhodococcoides kroppenstedtii]|uniref:type IV toxin-antitoxin system AbiEi family antitoxin n=1 Tax=Rhodococcoides kroppenstedtii TaxID=293050 RepID=UPI001BDEE023|nr:type IV toxin-antitoxin system AbiEi family antitoxin [Rhodococcus kroppenstedtii]MBT1194062.1 hypothetical protein [Rhodococcus kroppenstedtii]
MTLYHRRTGDHTDRQLHGLVRDGSLARVRRGTYTDGKLWRSASDADRYRLAVHAAMTCRAQAVASHDSAAALLGLPVLAPRRDRVHVTVDGRGGGKTTAATVEHRVPLSDVDVTVVDGVRVTTPARTALDLACVRPAVHGLCAVESSLRLGAEDLPGVLRRMGRRHGIQLARRAVERASPLTESLGESFSRALMLGWPEIPEPRLQHEFRDEHGLFVARTDFDWDGRLVGEFDGAVKYEGGGLTVVQEKLREDALRALGVHVVRWTWQDLLHPERLRAILTKALARAGLPAEFRPASGLPAEFRPASGLPADPSHVR